MCVNAIITTVKHTLTEFLHEVPTSFEALSSFKVLSPQIPNAVHAVALALCHNWCVQAH